MLERTVHQSFLPATSGRVRAFVWKYSREYGGRRPRHFHAEPELNLVVNGWATYGIGRAVVRVSQGEFVGFPPGQDHVLLDTSSDVYLYAIGMDPMFAAEVGSLSSGSALVPLHVRLPKQEVGAMTRRAELIVDRAGIEQPCAELWEHAHWMGQRAPLGRTGSLHVLTRRTLQLVADAPELGLEALATKVRANPSELSRHFHRDVGMTFVRYRTRLRLLRFIELVEQQRGNWLGAAIAAGFGSYSQCHRTFQSELGCAPREFFLGGVSRQMQSVYDD